jgi:hypothetical protein
MVGMTEAGQHPWLTLSWSTAQAVGVLLVLQQLAALPVVHLTVDAATVGHHLDGAGAVVAEAALRCMRINSGLQTLSLIVGVRAGGNRTFRVQSTQESAVEFDSMGRTAAVYCDVPGHLHSTSYAAADSAAGKLLGWLRSSKDLLLQLLRSKVPVLQSFSLLLDPLTPFLPLNAPVPSSSMLKDCYRAFEQLLKVGPRVCYGLLRCCICAWAQCTPTSLQDYLQSKAGLAAKVNGLPAPTCPACGHLLGLAASCPEMVSLPRALPSLQLTYKVEGWMYRGWQEPAERLLALLSMACTAGK